MGNPVSLWTHPMSPRGGPEISRHFDPPISTSMGAQHTAPKPAGVTCPCLVRVVKRSPGEPPYGAASSKLQHAGNSHTQIE